MEKLAENNIESFSLGLLVSIAEAPFSLALIAVAADSLLSLPNYLQIIMLAAYIIIAILPLVVTRVFVRHGKTIVDIQRWRIKNKLFFRIITGIGFITLALFIAAFEFLGAYVS